MMRDRNKTDNKGKTITTHLGTSPSLKGQDVTMQGNRAGPGKDWHTGGQGQNNKCLVLR